MQNPKPIEGLLYSKFKTYSSNQIPQGIKKNYTDTADTGSDYLCSIDYVQYGSLYYVTDVYYTQASNETTEVELSNKLTINKVNECWVESNNGGRAFARNIERISRSYGNNMTTFNWFHQSKNKDARIKSNSSTVNNSIIFPDDWNVRWSEFYDHVTNFLASGKNAHDDCADVLTGIVEERRERRIW